MAYLLQRAPGGGWLRYELPTDRAVWLRLETMMDGAPMVAVSAASPSAPAAPIPPDSALAVVLPLRRQGPIRYAVLPWGEPPFRNSDPLPGPEVMVLRGGDCLTWRRPDVHRRVFFDAFQRPRVVPHGGEEKPCPICDAPVVKGTPAVTCPACGVAYHHAKRAQCYEMAAGCAACGHPTGLAGTSKWVPEGFGPGHVGRLETPADLATLGTGWVGLGAPGGGP